MGWYVWHLLSQKNLVITNHLQFLKIGCDSILDGMDSCSETMDSCFDVAKMLAILIFVWFFGALWWHYLVRDNMKEIEAITKLATFQMICDGEADDDEVAILNNLPQRMAEHINEWDGNIRVRIPFHWGAELIQGSNDDELISKEELVEIINTTVQEYNDLPEEGDKLDTI